MAAQFRRAQTMQFAQHQQRLAAIGEGPGTGRIVEQPADTRRIAIIRRGCDRLAFGIGGGLAGERGRFALRGAEIGQVEHGHQIVEIVAASRYAGFRDRRFGRHLGDGWFGHRGPCSSFAPRDQLSDHRRIVRRLGMVSCTRDMVRQRVEGADEQRQQIVIEADLTRSHQIEQ